MSQIHKILFTKFTQFSNIFPRRIFSWSCAIFHSLSFMCIRFISYDVHRCWNLECFLLFSWEGEIMCVCIFMSLITDWENLSIKISKLKPQKKNQNKTFCCICILHDENIQSMLTIHFLENNHAFYHQRFYFCFCFSKTKCVWSMRISFCSAQNTITEIGKWEKCRFVKVIPYHA